MPSKNRIKQYLPESIYHVYNRGVEKRSIFNEPQDYKYFMGLFERYLEGTDNHNTQGLEYKNYSDRLEVVAFCLMANHYHIVLYQRDKKAMEEFMRSLMTAYSMYFNKKYSRVGSLFQDRYKAINIDTDPYAQWITAYVHRNPQNSWEKHPYSSFHDYCGTPQHTWVKPARILDFFDSPIEYKDFVRKVDINKDGPYDVGYFTAE